MNVLYTCDDNYVWIMGISMISLFENNRTMNNIHVYLLGENISSENKKKLSDIADKYDRLFTIIDTPELNIPDVLCSKRWPKSAFTRLYSGELLPASVDKVLYLDCDTIIAGEIDELQDYGESKHAICGVKDCISKHYYKNIGIDESVSYINAGVLLMDLAKLRKIDISKKIEEFLKQYEKQMHYADQDVLNGMFSGKFGILPPEYNVMTLVCTYSYNQMMALRKPSNYYSEKEIQKALEQPKIIHFTTCMLSIRPWFVDTDHPFSEMFIKYRKISPWASKKIQVNIKNSKKDKIIRVVLKMPSPIKYRLIGFIHAWLFPWYVRLNSKL